MNIDSGGNIVDSHEYILESITAWMGVDRNDVYGYTFHNYYVDFSSLSSIQGAITEIIEKFSLGCTVNGIRRNLGRVIVNLQYNGESLELEI